MTMNPLPPQAYTRETLQRAYQWLLTQNSSIKEMASNQDILVSMYLKAQRNGDSSLETPSIQNFKKELKSLATMMGDFQPQPTTAIEQPAITVVASGPVPAAANFSLDAFSLQAIADVKSSLNLSSDTEALRALIALGIKSFKKINT